MSDIYYRRQKTFRNSIQNEPKILKSKLIENTLMEVIISHLSLQHKQNFVLWNFITIALSAKIISLLRVDCGPNRLMITLLVRSRTHPNLFFFVEYIAISAWCAKKQLSLILMCQIFVKWWTKLILNFYFSIFRYSSVVWWFLRIRTRRISSICVA